MADKEAPCICITCDRPFPGDMKGEDAPPYFAQSALRPTAYDWDHFGNEARSITSYITAIADVIRYGTQEISDDTYRIILQLIGELSEEATRRLERSLDAMEAEWKRNKAVMEKVTQARKEGV